MRLGAILSMLPFELGRVVRSKANMILKRRPSSAPFLSGDTFRYVANALYDETARIAANKIRKNDLVFVSSLLLDEFRNVMIKTSEPFVLITHQGDTNIDASYRDIAESKNVIHWFAQNALLEHPKITPLPIGLEDAWRHNHGALGYFRENYKRNVPKISKVAFSFSLRTNLEKRLACYAALCRAPLAEELEQPLNASLYRKQLRKYLFVASPPGHGADCHRTWEAMYLGVVPLVEDNYMNRHFKKIGVPLYLIKDWLEIESWTEDDAQRIWEKTRAAADLSTLELPFWLNKFGEAKVS